MDFAKVVNIMEDIKDKIPEGKYLKLYEEIQKAHNTDADQGGIRHIVSIEYIVEIDVINLTEIELDDGWQGTDADWASYIEADKPMDSEIYSEITEYPIYLTEHTTIEPIGEIMTIVDTARYCRDIIHNKTNKLWWIYLADPPIDDIYKKVNKNVKELEESRKLGLKEYRVCPLVQHVLWVKPSNT